VGYAISGTTCVALLTVNPWCISFIGLTCTNCHAGYYIGSSGQCVPANPLCLTYNMTTGACLSCNAGYGLSSGSCVLYSTLNPECYYEVNAVCIECYQGFYINANNNGICTAVSPLCKSYNMNTGVCTSCYSGVLPTC